MLVLPYENSLTIFLSMVFLLISFVLMVVTIRSALLRHSHIEKRLADVSASDDKDVIPKKKQNFLSTLGDNLTLPSPEDMSRIRFQLSQAGFYHPNAVRIYHAARVICLFVPQLILLLAFSQYSSMESFQTILVIFCVSIGLSLYAPILYVRRRMNKRREECRNGFPDMMDLLIACIEAGLSMNAALVRVGHEIGGRYPALRANLDIMNLELRAGKVINSAMRSFANRVDLEEARSLAVMLKQAEEMGASVGRTLRTFSDEMRMKRMMKAEEKAMALSAKLTVPLILFIFPTILCMILLPVGIRIGQGM